MESDSIDFNLWIADGEQRWVSRMVPDLTPMLEEMRELLGDQADELLQDVPQVVVSLSWSIPDELGEEAFAFTVPEGMEQVASVSETLQERFGQAASQVGSHEAMLGQPAPEFDLELLEGGRVSLADHRDQVVILDFWATWCPPCVHALPILTSVAERYREQGVVLYAVNVAENAGAVQRFLDREDLKLKVPMDNEGELSERYGVRGIPQTVLIGRDGTVQAVHVGLLPNLEEQLSREVEQLLEGNNLVGG